MYADGLELMLFGADGEGNNALRHISLKKRARTLSSKGHPTALLFRPLASEIGVFDRERQGEDFKVVNRVRWLDFRWGIAGAQSINRRKEMLLLH